VRITRLYHTENLICGKTTQLDKNTSSHLVRVLRTKAETPVILFNGDGFDYLCKTLNTHAKKTLVAIEEKIKINNESNLFITLIQGMSRLDRMETTIQKSVELGVNKIIPVLCRSIIPEISEISSLNKIDSLLNPDALKIILNPETKKSLKELNFRPNEKNSSTIEIFIGPEGGLAEDEINHLQSLQFQNICFGPRILRTETAGPAVISALQMLWGDF